MSEQPQTVYTTLTLDYDGPLALVTLNRPDKRNAISYELINELLRALGEVEELPSASPGPDRRWQGVLLGDGSRQPALYRRPDARGEPGRFPHHGALVPHALRVSQGHDLRRQWPSHSWRVWIGDAVRLHAGLNGSDVRLHRSAHRICPGDCLDLSAAPGRRKARARLAASPGASSAPKRRFASDW